MNRFLIPQPLWQNTGIAVVRFVVGFFLIYHGWEVFSPSLMNGYLEWDMFKNSPSGKLLVYGGKLAELVSGVLLFIGLFTRIASFIVIVNLGYISLFVGHGKIWYDDQHPFLFVLLGFVFFFTGPGRWSIDHLLFQNNK